MHIAAIQMVSTPDVATNLATAARLLQQAADQGAELAALPEYFCLMGHSDRDKLAHAEAPGHGPLQTFLREQALRHDLWLVGGTLPLQSADPARVSNSTLVFNPQGEPVALAVLPYLLQALRARHLQAVTLRQGLADLTAESMQEAAVLPSTTTPSRTTP